MRRCEIVSFLVELDSAPSVTNIAAVEASSNTKDSEVRVADSQGLGQVKRFHHKQLSPIVF